jgi:hypothetical protein
MQWLPAGELESFLANSNNFHNLSVKHSGNQICTKCRSRFRVWKRLGAGRCRPDTPVTGVLGRRDFPPAIPSAERFAWSASSQSISARVKLEA